MTLTRRDVLRGAGVVATGAGFACLLTEPAFAHGDEEMGGEEQPTSRVRRWAMVIDLRACDGCVGLGIPPQCTQSCIWARFVPEGQQWIETYELPEGAEHRPPGTPRSFLPAPCMQCQNAPCVNVCPVGATFHTPEGVVLIDQERCIGCRYCMAACPYDRRFFNWGEPLQPPDVAEAPYDVRTQLPAMRGTVMKCDFCTDRLAAGGLPSCVEACPHNAIYMGDLEEDIATNGARMVRLSSLLAEAGVHRHKEELGTEPRVYYIAGHGEAAGQEAPGMGLGHGEPPEEEGGVHQDEEAPMEGDENEDGHEDAESETMGAVAADPSTPPPFLKDRLEWPWRRIVAALEEMEH
jgi:molybdopterin-containing oxidoreductase family iron-sulfur binding subunit